MSPTGPVAPRRAFPDDAESHGGRTPPAGPHDDAGWAPPDGPHDDAGWAPPDGPHDEGGWTPPAGPPPTPGPSPAPDDLQHPSPDASPWSPPAPPSMESLRQEEFPPPSRYSAPGDATRLVPSDTPDTTRLVPSDTHDATRLVAHDTPDTTRLAPHEAAGATRLVPADTPDTTRLVPADTPDTTRLVPADTPDATHLAPQEPADTTRLASADTADSTRLTTPPTPLPAMPQGGGAPPAPPTTWSGPWGDGPRGWTPPTEPEVVLLSTDDSPAPVTGGWGARKVPRPIGGVPADAPTGGRFAAPPPTSVQAEKTTARHRWPLVVAVLVLAMALGTGAWWQYLRPQQNDPDIIGPTSGRTDVIKVQRGDEAVRGYLNALRSGDARTALSYGQVGGPGSQVLLTDAVLRESLSRAPIENIVVPDADANASQIPAQYTIGQETVNTVFRVAKTADGGWQLARTTASIQITAARSDRVPVIVNGVAMPDVTFLELMPGSYHFTTGLPFLAYSSQIDITVPSIEYAKPLQALTLEITQEGRAALTEAGRTSTSACLARQELAPPNCPFQAANLGRPIRQSSIRWALTNDPWSTASWTLNASDPAVSEATLLFTITLSVEFENGDRSPDNPVGSGKVAMTTDISKTRAADLEVKWTPL